MVRVHAGYARSPLLPFVGKKGGAPWFGLVGSGFLSYMVLVFNNVISICTRYHLSSRYSSIKYFF
jgi:hypothetical protein